MMRHIKPQQGRWPDRRVILVPVDASNVFCLRVRTWRAEMPSSPWIAVMLLPSSRAMTSCFKFHCPRLLVQLSRRSRKRRLGHEPLQLLKLLVKIPKVLSCSSLKDDVGLLQILLISTCPSFSSLISSSVSSSFASFLLLSLSV